MNSGLDRLGTGLDRLAGMDRLGMDRLDRGADLDRLGGTGGFDRMGSGIDRLGPSMDRLGSGLDRMSSSMDRRVRPPGPVQLGPHQHQPGLQLPDGHGSHGQHRARQDGPEQL